MSVHAFVYPQSLAGGGDHYLVVKTFYMTDVKQHVAWGHVQADSKDKVDLKGSIFQVILVAADC